MTRKVTPDEFLKRIETMGSMYGDDHVIAFCNETMRQVSTAGKLAKIEDIESAVDLPNDWYRDADEVIRLQMVAILKQHEERGAAEVNRPNIVIINVFVDPSQAPTDLSMIVTLIEECKQNRLRIVDSDEFPGGQAIVVWRGSDSVTDAELVAAVVASDFGSRACEQLAPGKEPLDPQSPLGRIKSELEKLSVEQLRELRADQYGSSLEDYKQHELADLVLEMWTGQMPINPLSRMNKSEIVQEALDEYDPEADEDDLALAIDTIRGYAA